MVQGRGQEQAHVYALALSVGLCLFVCVCGRAWLCLFERMVNQGEAIFFIMWKGVSILLLPREAIERVWGMWGMWGMWGRRKKERDRYTGGRERKEFGVEQTNKKERRNEIKAKRRQKVEKRREGVSREEKRCVGT